MEEKVEHQVYSSTRNRRLPEFTFTDRLLLPVKWETWQVTVDLWPSQGHVLLTVTVPLPQYSCLVARIDPSGIQEIWAAGFPVTALHTAVLFQLWNRVTSGVTAERKEGEKMLQFSHKAYGIQRDICFSHKSGDVKYLSMWCSLPNTWRWYPRWKFPSGVTTMPL